MFIFIWVLIFVVQIIMTQFTQDVFKCARNGLYIVQWAICIGFSLLTIPLDYAVKFIPEKICPELG